MLWHTSIAAQRLTPRGGVAVACAGFLAGGDYHRDLGRWRS
ncbi:hypothetical protein [Pseudosporangium ferrugineum]|uniref:Uncharacterized protein n=1 Tax=Pseudosporangium ferrugineum TaxID=439699 RepID=A0A2T0RQA7_9ACTN|nr:hypothetical protein [Pseudosporangium ferrugineum]PRY23379.1 hypothetical protein CLV70_115107 [Pseudosporangium ferrugineum]